jgi:hypothetical protein
MQGRNEILGLEFFWGEEALLSVVDMPLKSVSTIEAELSSKTSHSHFKPCTSTASGPGGKDTNAPWSSGEETGRNKHSRVTALIT